MLDKSMFVTNYSNEVTALQAGSTVKMRMVIFRRVRRIAKDDYWLRHVCLSDRLPVCPHRTQLPLDGFSRNLILEDFSKILREN